MILNKLVKIYDNWGDQNNLQPLLSADEYLRGHGELTQKQYDFVNKFIRLCDKAQEQEENRILKEKKKINK